MIPRTDENGFPNGCGELTFAEAEKFDILDEETLSKLRIKGIYVSSEFLQDVSRFFPVGSPITTQELQDWLEIEEWLDEIGYGDRYSYAWDAIMKRVQIQDDHDYFEDVYFDPFNIDFKIWVLTSIKSIQGYEEATTEKLLDYIPGGDVASEELTVESLDELLFELAGEGGLIKKKDGVWNLTQEGYDFLFYLENPLQHPEVPPDMQMEWNLDMY